MPKKIWPAYLTTRSKLGVRNNSEDIEINFNKQWMRFAKILCQFEASPEMNFLRIADHFMQANT